MELDSILVLCSILLAILYLVLIPIGFGLVQFQ